MRRRCYLTVMLQGDERIDILWVHGHFEGYVNDEFVVSGDTWNEVYDDLVEMGYLR